MNQKSNTNCEEILQQVCNDLSEDLHSPLCQELRDHIATCQDCQNNLMSMQKTVDLYKCLGKSDIPARVHDRLITLLNLESA